MCIEWSPGRIASQFMGSHRILCDSTWIPDNSTCCKFNSSTMVLGLSMEMHKLLSMAYKNMISNAKSLIKQKEEGHKNKDHVVLMKDYWSKVELQLSVGSIRILRCWTKLLPLSLTSDIELKVHCLKMKGGFGVTNPVVWRNF